MSDCVVLQKFLDHYGLSVTDIEIQYSTDHLTLDLQKVIHGDFFLDIIFRVPVGTDVGLVIKIISKVLLSGGIQLCTITPLTAIPKTMISLPLFVPKTLLLGFQLGNVFHSTLHQIDKILSEYPQSNKYKKVIDWISCKKTNLDIFNLCKMNPNVYFQALVERCLSYDFNILASHMIFTRHEEIIIADPIFTDNFFDLSKITSDKVYKIQPHKPMFRWRFFAKPKKIDPIFYQHATPPNMPPPVRKKSICPSEALSLALTEKDELSLSSHDEQKDDEQKDDDICKFSFEKTTIHNFLEQQNEDDPSRYKIDDPPPITSPKTPTLQLCVTPISDDSPLFKSCSEYISENDKSA
nr:hypothetical protein [Abalone asfa-like virus]